MATGTWQDSKNVQYAEFVPTDALYVKLTVLEAYGTGAKQSCAVAEINLFEYSDGVIEPGDKTALTNLINEVSGLDTDRYSKTTVDELLASVNEAQALLDAELVSQTMLNNVYTKILNAKNALIDISDAKNTIARLDALKEEDYTADSWETFVSELAVLKTQIDNVTSNREVLDIVVKANYLEAQLIKVEVKDADKSLLAIAIEMAEKADLENVVPAVVTEFNEALTNAKEVYAKTNATQSEVDSAFARLANVMHMLQFYKGDKTALQKQVDQINGLDESKYIESSWSNMLPALDKANDVLADENAMQGEVDEAFTELVKAFLNLRLKPNKDLLQELINKANNLNAANYSAKTWAVVADALNEAKAVLEDPEATQDQVDTIKDVLTKAIAGLQVEIKETSNPVKAGDTTASVATGDTTNLNAALGVAASLSMLAYLSKKKKK